MDAEGLGSYGVDLVTEAFSVFLPALESDTGDGERQLSNTEASLTGQLQT